MTNPKFEVEVTEFKNLPGFFGVRRNGQDYLSFDIDTFGHLEISFEVDCGCGPEVEYRRVPVEHIDALIGFIGRELKLLREQSKAK